MDYGTPPKISVDWGTPPIISCIVKVVCPSQAVAAALSSGRTNISPNDGGKGYYDELGMEMEFNVHASNPEQMITPDIQKQMKPMLSQMKINLVDTETFQDLYQDLVQEVTHQTFH
jgi:hypothetical protein